jgi:hypothetical protein
MSFLNLFCITMPFWHIFNVIYKIHWSDSNDDPHDGKDILEFFIGH